MLVGGPEKAIDTGRALVSATRRIQLLMEPAEFRRLKTLARERKTSVAALIRSAVREAYLSPTADREPIVEAIAAMRLPAIDWRRAKNDEARAGLA